MDRIVCDLDDFEDATADAVMPLLDQLHAASNGRFKVTLFTIPGRTTRLPGRPWIELAAHGWDHSHLECRDWTRERTLEVLHAIPSAYVSIFKAPYWTASPLVYETLAEEGWAVAEHPRNADRLPGSLRRYVLAPDHRIGAPHPRLPIVQAHGHVTDVEHNGLRERFGDFLRLAQSGMPFAFVSEVIV